MNETVSAQMGRFRELHYVQVGQGRPVIALHGFGQTSYSWRHLAAALPNDTALYAFDLRGCGASAKPRDEHYALRDQAALICDFIGERDLKDVTLVGHSMGGGIALLAALDLISHANRLRSLVLIGSIAYPLGIPWFMRLMRTPLLGRVALSCLPPRLMVQIIIRQAFYDPGKIEDAAVGAYAQNLASPDGRYAQLKTAQYIIPADLDRITASYERINVPTLIIWGSDDRIIPFENGTRLNAAIAQSRLLTVPACGHIPQEERPDIAIPMIREFLADAPA